MNQNDMIALEICGKIYEIDTNINLNDMKLYSESLEQGKNEKNAIIDVIHQKLEETGVQTAPSIKEMYAQNDSVYEPYVLAVLNNWDALKTMYERTDINLSVLERFAISSHCYYQQCAFNIREGMRTIAESAHLISKNADFSSIKEFQQKLVPFREIVDKMQEILRPIQEMYQRIHDTIAPIQEKLSELISNIQIPTYTDEQRAKLRKSYEMWGKIGWSVIPHAPIKLFNEFPATCKEADRIALSYFKREGMENLFSQLKEKPIKKEDLESAIFCYNTRQYKACALLLFGLIDAKLIRLQPKNNRAVGIKAVKKFETKFKPNVDTEHYLYYALNFLGLLECLKTFFESGNNFCNEPSVINRNYVDHGMNRRSVRKKDCIQLFLALYNLTEFLGLERSY